MSEPLRLYVDTAWRRTGPHTPLLFPQWGITLSKKTPFTRHLFETYPFDTTQYAIVNDVREADVVLFPYRYDTRAHRDIFDAALAVARAHGKHIVIDATGDRDYTIMLPEAIALKYGGYRFLQKENEIILPLYADDLLERYCGREFSPRQKRSLPAVGFAGWSEAPLLRRMYWSLKEIPQRVRGVVDPRYRACVKGVFFRRQALSILEASSFVESNILARPSYSAHAKTASKNLDELRREFVENALASDLCLDIRGDANNSARLFEILSLGRVPLILDTERNFPFSDEIDYRSFSIIIDFRDVDRLPELTREAYDSLLPEEWLAMQERARAVYRNWMRPDAMTRHLMKRIRAQISW